MFISDIIIDEEVKEVPGYDGKFVASKSGRVLNTQTKKELIQYVVNGYVLVLMNGKQRRVHKIVMDTFNPNPNPKLYTEINHKDENKLNNNLDNLEWCTHEYNLKYGTRSKRAGDTHGTDVVCLDLDGKFIKEYPSIASTEKDGFVPGCVGLCVRGKAKTHKGYIWMKKFEYESIKDKNNIKYIAQRSYDKRRNSGRHKEPIYQISLDGIIARQWDSVTDAIKCGNTYNVKRCVNREKQPPKQRYFTSNGYIWIKVKDYNNMTFEEYIKYVQDSLNINEKLSRKHIETAVKKDFELNHKNS